ncbi:MAG: hypothetical protein QOK40_110 [Miltoncostaeaceae bacterium]|nr:hypothetical protein [Miltoncostaeaceae bacterium]
MNDDVVGLVDGSLPATTRRFAVALEEGAHLQLDELVVVEQELEDGAPLAHYGIVVEGSGQIEGAAFASDTARIARDGTMPGLTARRVEVQVLRTVPELWLAPEPGAPVRRAQGVHRELALFCDQMEGRRLPVGLDQSGAAVHADFAFMNGERGGHVSISGISGVATKTSYALFLLYMLFETPAGRRLLGQAGPQARAVIFNVKGEDLLHIDLPNARYPRDERDREGWAALGVQAPGPFGDVRLWAPRARGAAEGARVTDVRTRPHRERDGDGERAVVEAFGWSPWEFIRGGLLRFVLADEGERTQVAFVEQRVRVQLARHAWPLAGQPGAAVMCAAEGGFDLERLVARGRSERPAGDGVPIRSFADLVDYLTGLLADEKGYSEPAWTGGTQSNTVMAFLRRLYAASPRLGQLVATGVRPPALERRVNVIDLHDLHDSAQRFVVGAVLAEVFAAKQGAGREPLRFVVLDELNKYAPREGQSPLKDLLVDIAARGRSLGVLLIGAQQSAAEVEPALPRNAAIKVAGRLDAGEAGDYRFLTPELRERASRFLPGTMVLDQPIVPAPIPIRFPFPAFATNPGEGALAPARAPASEEALAAALAELGGS